MAQALARPVLIPLAYAHKGEAWSDWHDQLESASEVNGYGNAEKLRFLPARLEGTARHIFDAILAANANATYPQIVTLFTYCTV